jgi:hypothetical protein
MTIHEYDIDLNFRPKGYFWPLDLRTHVLSSIKGAERKAYIKEMFEEGREGEIPDEVIQPALPKELRIAAGRIHPWLMGGEYLPNLRKKEVEIARITLASTTQDVTCVYAYRAKDKIRYRVVDEYVGDTIAGRKTRSSKLPLTLMELTDFFLGAWDLLEVLDMNFGDEGYPGWKVRPFFEGSSEFYPSFGELLKQRVETWLQQKHSELNEDADDTDGDLHA